MDYSHARIQLLDEDFALVDRMTLDEAAAALERHDDPAVRKLGADLRAALDRKIDAVAEAQRRDYVAAQARYAANGLTYRLPEALQP